MESNLRNGNNSDPDGHLPPRKRLLAGLKKRSLGKKSENPSSSKEKVVSEDARINSFMDYLVENPNLSIDEIVEESRRGVDVAVKRAVAKRAVAEKKAIAAAKCMLMAKGLLKISADISDELASRNWHAKKKKKRKQAERLHEKHMNAENCKTDEDLARCAHHTMNSSERIAERSKNSDLKIYENKRAKGLSILEDPRVNGEAESSHSKERILESSNDFMTKEGALKQKKLPPHVCSSKDL